MIHIIYLLPVIRMHALEILHVQVSAVSFTTYFILLMIYYFLTMGLT